MINNSSYMEALIALELIHFLPVQFHDFVDIGISQGLNLLDDLFKLTVDF